jgi:V8-like Glu-specific endopeptidase
MEDTIKEKDIKTSPEPVSFKGTETILDQMNNSICRIYTDNGKGTGFFTQIPYKLKLLPVLITNNHVINKDDILNNKKFSIYLNNDKKIKRIELDNNRLKYTNEKLDITIIEIKDNDKLNNKYLELDDEIMNYIKLNKKEDINYLSDIYSNNSIYLINYPEDKNVVVSYGQSPNFSESEIFHKCITKEGSSGSPILLINNQKLIGIHYGSSKQYDFNKGRLLIYSIIEFENIKNNLLLINKEGKRLNYNNKKY